MFPPLIQLSDESVELSKTVKTPLKTLCRMSSGAFFLIVEEGVAASAYCGFRLLRLSPIAAFAYHTLDKGFSKKFSD